MNNGKKKSNPRCLYHAATHHSFIMTFRHRVVKIEPARFVVEVVPCYSDKAIHIPGGLAYADRSELESTGSTRAKFDGGVTASVTLFGTLSAASAAAGARPAPIPSRAGTDGNPPWDREAFEGDPSDHQAAVAFYAKVVRGIPGQGARAPRGVWALEDCTILIFGNDASPKDKRFEHEVNLFRRRMTKARLVKELGYAVSPDGESWAMLVNRPSRPADLPDEDFIDRLRTMLWESWIEACQIAQL